jgi:hypothetical protein
MLLMVRAAPLSAQTNSPPAHGKGGTGPAVAAATVQGTNVLNGEFVQYKINGTLTATLTLSSNQVYDVTYAVSWKNEASTWNGAIRGDLNGEITGTGVNNRGRTFSFGGKFVDGVARCAYKEAPGGRDRTGYVTFKR